ncbi:hypothetical protein Fuma_01313 [Fuerstiella marisgermanici]|uniref:Uncharacterized protein n=1 Tax=Fuerstiella marisgermanici TaxID=1891926 RepID=A0A1P8WCD7_9PLAN|nr:hypothetical protein Fuma_01313 [Fuerstiella marisgermanici]
MQVVWSLGKATSGAAIRLGGTKSVFFLMLINLLHYSLLSELLIKPAPHVF